MTGPPPRGVRDVLLIARIWAFISLLSVLVRLCSVPRLLRLCGLGAPRPPADAARILACVERALARHPVNSRSACLNRSLTLYRFLGARATDIQFCLGVRYANARDPRRPGQLQGHAWLLRNGLPYLEVDHYHVRRFRVIYRYPPRERRVA